MRVIRFVSIFLFFYVFMFFPSSGVTHSGELDSTGVITTSISDYFRAANENVGALDCNVEIHARDVGEVKKRMVRNRDGNRCAICGSRSKLEVDHMRGLQNGGTNDVFNLALLCDHCHTAKTKYDNSLRRKRERICRKKMS